MEWNLFTGCKLVREDGKLSLFVREVIRQSSEARPKGSDINFELAEGALGEEVAEFLASSANGEITLGKLRAGAGGGFKVSFDQLDLGKDRERITQNLDSDGYGIPEEAFVAVVRGEGAPGTRGIDGGGAGIPKVLLNNPEIVRAECLRENLEEIGIGNEKGRIGFNLSDPLKGFGIEKAVAREWKASFGTLLEIPWQTEVPIAAYASVSILPAPDRLVVDDWQVDNIAIALERKNSSVEILQSHKIDLPDLPFGQYRFWDLERNNRGERLERMIAVVCKGKKLFVIFFRAGAYLECSPAIPLTEDCLEQYANSKCRRFLSVLGWI